jgi:hypothetical protein
MNFRSIFLRAVAVCIAIALPTFAPLAQADPLAYYMQGGDNAGFGVIDLSTGAFSQLGNSGGEAISGLGYYNGVIYAGGYLFTPQPNALYAVNPANGSLTLIGNSSEPYMDIGSTMNGVYKLGYDGNLYSINVATGASTLIGPTGLPLNHTCCGNGYIGMSADGSNLYINQNDELWLINTTNGLASLVGSTGPAIFSAEVSIDGTYYGNGFTNGEVFTFDPNTAAVTAGPFTNGLGDIWGLAPDTVGVPGPIAGAGLPGLIFAAGGLLVWRRKQKTWPLSWRRAA